MSLLAWGGVPSRARDADDGQRTLTVWVTQDVPSLLGRPARSFEQFSSDYAAAFS